MNRPVLTELRSWNIKAEIIKAAKNLKGTKIYMKENYSKDILQNRKHLFKIMMEARDKGQRKIIKYDKLIINGEVCPINQLQKADHEKSDQENESKRKQGPRSLSVRLPN
ncbi:hypothetical protein HHI36_007765 [Cryptolaemus montrouzieri]|uniref:Uncharacterized protein n=1 Tax=Cryptolaemus montrouzieri TaxID=559131 RepID=A0ABD2MQU0_9CUCU